MPATLCMNPSLLANLLPATGGTAVSDSASEVRTYLQDRFNSFRGSRALYGARSDAISDVWATTFECSRSDWDGAGAAPISPRAAVRAADLIELLPTDLAAPEVAPEPDGSISLDWIASRSRLVTVSVGPGPSLAYAWIDGSNRGHGVVHFGTSEAPAHLVDTIRTVIGDGHATVRLA